MADYTPLFLPGQAVTFTAKVDVTGGQPVEVSGDRQVSPAAATSTRYVGGAGFNALAGERVTVYSRGTIHRYKSSAAIAAGDRVTTTADGRISTTASGGIGLALTAATGADQLVQVMDC